MKSNILKFSVLAVFVSVFSCSEETTKSSKTSIQDNMIDLKQINFVGQWMGEGNRELLIRDFVREYEFLNQEINVNLKFPEEIGFNRYSAVEAQAFVESVIEQKVASWDVVLINDDVDGIGTFLGDKNWAKKHLVDFSKFPELIRNTIPEIDLDKVKKDGEELFRVHFLKGNIGQYGPIKKLPKS